MYVFESLGAELDFGSVTSRQSVAPAEGRARRGAGVVERDFGSGTRTPRAAGVVWIEREFLRVSRYWLTDSLSRSVVLVG